MKKYSFSLILVFCLVVVGTLLSCKGSSVPLLSTKETTTETTITKIPQEKAFVSPADSSYYKAYLDCINGKVVIKSQSTSKPKNAGLQPPKVNLKDNILTCDCSLKEQEYRAKWESENKIINTITATTTPVPVPNELTFWESFQIWAGRILIFLIIAFLIGRYVKSKKLFK